MSSISTFLEEISVLRDAVNKSLVALLQWDKACPPVLAEAMRYSTEAGGKRLRPILVLLACEACGGSAEQAMPAACALEMIHTYSLIHDDLPAMDDDDLRRGLPTCHKAYGEANAILAGDALLTYAFEVMATKIHPGQLAAQCCAILAKAAGAEGMVGGQTADLQSETEPPESCDQLETIHRRKTGALIESALLLGATIANANSTQKKQLSEYGHAIGLAFQITDDLLDCTGDVKKLGKHVHKDANRGKATYPGFLGLEASRIKANELITHACLMVEPFGEQGQHLEALARYIQERDN